MDCRYCNTCLDDGDVFEVLQRRYPDKTDAEIMDKARMYGWTPENKKRFLKEVIVQYDDKPQITVCPECGGVSPLDPSAPKEYTTIPPKRAFQFSERQLKTS